MNSIDREVLIYGDNLASLMLVERTMAKKSVGTFTLDLLLCKT